MQKRNKIIYIKFGGGGVFKKIVVTGVTLFSFLFSFSSVLFLLQLFNPYSLILNSFPPLVSHPLPDGNMISTRDHAHLSHTTLPFPAPFFQHSSASNPQIKVPGMHTFNHHPKYKPYLRIYSNNAFHLGLEAVNIYILNYKPHLV